MAQFDPDVYLSKKAVGGFDPDAYLSKQGAEPGIIESAAAGAGQRFGNTVLNVQKYAGKGIAAIDKLVNGANLSSVITGRPTSALGRVGQWLIDDATQGQAKLSSENQPYKEANPIANASGQIASDLIVTAPVGGLLAKGARTLAPGVAATKSGANVIRAVETAGSQGGGLTARSIGGAVTGGASAALVSPDDITQGALIGGAAPSVIQAAGKFGSLLGGASRSAIQAAGKFGSLLGGASRSAKPDAAKLKLATDLQEAGYVIPPSDIKPQNPIMEAIGGLSGKVKTAQEASARNAKVTTDLVRKELGVTGDTPLTTETLDALRAKAGEAYQAISGLGKFSATKGELPASVGVKSFTDRLTMAPKSEVDASELVRAWKQANHDATGYYRAYGRDANPETLAKAKQAADSAKQIDDFLAKKLKESGAADMLDALKQARVQIAKTYTVEKALNGTTGEVSAQALAKELAKGKPLSGGLLTAAKAGQAFPKATQALKEAPKDISPLDWAMATGTLATTGNPLSVAMLGARPLARNALLSKPVQQYASREAAPNALTRLVDQSGSRLAYRAAPVLLGADR